ncbi:hypothetical protein [Parvularcula sp. LCG005]|uniref:hypothetical protein n=1 Tax=Parvularcula sp. LCG005 TaxID=3078805 RepID=UPI0029425208|nr:hypothetical protein [Parvularcula sp. LCG005]WOI54378.1 hypothetical protein RUI03_05090 [Parvularcula sp. LCG005]
MIRTFILLAGCGALAACASSTPTSGSSPAASAGAAQVARTEAPDLGALPTYGIPRGRCGMILYTLSGSKSLPVFRSTDEGRGLVEINGALTELSLVGRGGETRMAVPSSQYFRGQQADGTEVTVAAVTSWGTSFPSGSYVEAGTLTITAADGWSRVLPVAGIAGCRP